jgi:carbonic anhydrase/acetyltransferase-like protein (isoleucine patch superfamily)
MEYEYEGATPEVHESAAVCAEATLVGAVSVGAESSVWPGAVLRGDVEPVVVGANTHVEENTMLHGATVGDRVMVGHGAVVDTGATVGDGSLVGSNATVNNGVDIGERSIVASGAVVPDGSTVPPSSFARGVPATVSSFEESGVDGEAILGFYSPDTYRELVAGHGDLFGAGP